MPIKLPSWMDDDEGGDYFPQEVSNSTHHCVLLVDSDPCTKEVTVTAAEIDNELVTA